MPQPSPAKGAGFGAPRFYLTERQPLRPGAILLGTLVAVAVLSAGVFAMRHSGDKRFRLDDSGPSRSAGATPAGGSPDDEKDDPSQIDTVVLGDPADAPVPARHGNHVSPVHPTILVRLPRFGSEVGLIPNTDAGRLLYDWLAAFNQASYAGLESALPSVAPAGSAAAQMELRQQTGGFNLLSCKEVQPGVVVFRMRDQRPAGNEVLGTLQMLPGSIPPAIASFSLRAVPATGEGAAPADAPPPAETAR